MPSAKYTTNPTTVSIILFILKNFLIFYLTKHKATMTDTGSPIATTDITIARPAMNISIIDGETRPKEQKNN